MTNFQLMNKHHEKSIYIQGAGEIHKAMAIKKEGKKYIR